MGSQREALSGRAARTLQVWVLSCQKADHGLQLAELPVVRVDISDTVDPGTQGSQSHLTKPCFPSSLPLSPHLLCAVTEVPTYQSLARVRSGCSRSCRPETRDHFQYGAHPGVRIAPEFFTNKCKESSSPQSRHSPCRTGLGWQRPRLCPCCFHFLKCPFSPLPHGHPTC